MVCRGNAAYRSPLASVIHSRREASKTRGAFTMRRITCHWIVGALLASGVAIGGCGDVPPDESSRIDDLTVDDVERLLMRPESEIDPRLLELAVRPMTRDDEALLKRVPELESSGALRDLYPPSDPELPRRLLSQCAGGVAHGTWKQLEGEMGVFYGTLRDRSEEAMGVLAGVYGFGRVMGLAMSRDKNLRFDLTGTISRGRVSMRLLDPQGQVVGQASGMVRGRHFCARWARYCHQPCEVSCAAGSRPDPSGACRCVPIPCKRGECPDGMYCDTCPSVCDDDAEVCMAVCGPPVCRPKPEPRPDPRPTPCSIARLGGEKTTCRPVELWIRHARAECARRAKVLTDFSPRQPCADGRAFQAVEFECCDSPKEPPQPPPVPPCRPQRLGYDGHCMPKSGWIEKAKAACRRGRLALGRLTGRIPCGITMPYDQRSTEAHPDGTASPRPVPEPLLGGLSFECCMAQDPPPPPAPPPPAPPLPPPPSCVDQSVTGECRSADDWLARAKKTCAGRGLELRKRELTKPCRLSADRPSRAPCATGDERCLGAYAGIDYVCCQPKCPDPGYYCAVECRGLEAGVETCGNGIDDDRDGAIDEREDCVVGVPLPQVPSGCDAPDCGCTPR
jgi:hypothetical protein